MIVHLSDDVVGLLRALHTELSGEAFVGSVDYYGNVERHDCSQEVWALGEVVSAIDAASGAEQ